MYWLLLVVVIRRRQREGKKRMEHGVLLWLCETAPNTQTHHLRVLVTRNWDKARRARKGELNREVKHAGPVASPLLLPEIVTGAIGPL